MRLPLNEADETELNMTPMIDIVFQLIIFFLLSLKFKTIDRRIESMLPKKVGLDMKPAIADDEDKISVKVFRRDVRAKEKAYTLIKIDNAEQFRLPVAWKGRSKESPERIRAYDRVIASVSTVVRKRLAIYGGNPDLVKGEIKAPPPRGGSVPHGDVIALLDTFIANGMTNVWMEGQAAPLNSRERASRAAARR